MKTDETVLIIVLIFNTVIAFAYLLYGVLLHKKNEEGENRRISYIIQAGCIFLCPVIGIIFLGVGMLLKTIFFHTDVNLDDVVFSKVKIRQIVKADEEREKNYVPVQEALEVSDYNSQRTLVLNVLKGNVDNSLNTVNLAMTGGDSETSHYAASMMSKKLNEFRINEKKMRTDISNEASDAAGNPDKCYEDRLTLIRYMNHFLKQQVFSSIEQEMFVNEMADTAEQIFKYVEDNIKLGREMPVLPEAADYTETAMRLMETNKYDEAAVWCLRAMEYYPEAVEAYKCTLELKYRQEDYAGFMETLDSLKKSGIIIDIETMGIIRFFQNRAKG